MVHSRLPSIPRFHYSTRLAIRQDHTPTQADSPETCRSERDPSRTLRERSRWDSSKHSDDSRGTVLSRTGAGRLDGSKRQETTERERMKRGSFRSETM